MSDALAIGLLQTPLNDATAIRTDTPVRAARAILEDGRFDQAPVLDEHGTPVGFLLLNDLARSGRVDKCVRPILPGALATDATPIAEGVKILHRSEFVFVLSEQTISGFVVPSDLNRQAGRSHFFFGLMSLEMGMARVLRSRCTDEQVLDHLPHQRDRIKKAMERAAAEQMDTDAISQLTLTQLLTLAASDLQLIETLGFESAEAWTNSSRLICKLRNRVAHSVQPVLQRRDDLGWVCSVDETVRQLLDALDHTP